MRATQANAMPCATAMRLWARECVRRRVTALDMPFGCQHANACGIIPRALVGSTAGVPPAGAGHGYDICLLCACCALACAAQLHRSLRKARAQAARLAIN